MKITRHASARWSGTLREGKGAISTESGALIDKYYGFRTRFEGESGTNPEELLGAAHAGCFTMALSLVLGEAGLTAERLTTKADVTLEQSNGQFSITAVHLDIEASVPVVDAPTFLRLAETAKATCPLSKVIRAPITLSARLANDEA